MASFATTSEAMRSTASPTSSDRVGHQVSLADLSRPWWVLHVKSRQEKALAGELEASQLAYYLPLNQAVRYYGKRKVQVIEPLFPGYLFFQGPREALFKADRKHRVAAILPVADQRQLVEQIHQLRVTLDAAGYLLPAPLLVGGVRAEITSGPFKGMIGTIVDSGPRSRLLLEISALGQGAILEVDGSLLRPLSS